VYLGTDRIWTTEAWSETGTKNFKVATGSSLVVVVGGLVDFKSQFGYVGILGSSAPGLIFIPVAAMYLMLTV
jgi:hypothetical protein